MFKDFIAKLTGLKEHSQPSTDHAESTLSSTNLVPLSRNGRNPITTGGPNLGSLTSGKTGEHEVFAPTNKGEMLHNSHLADRLAAKHYRSSTSTYLTSNAAQADNFKNFNDMLNPTRGVYLSKHYPVETVVDDHDSYPIAVEPVRYETEIEIPILTPEDVIFQILDKLQTVGEEQLLNSEYMISKNQSEELRRRWVMKLAGESSTPGGVLRRLCEEGDSLVRQVVADNQNTPIDLVWKLAKDSDVDIRYVLAENHTIGMEVLAALADDDNPYVASRAKKTLKRMQCGMVVDTVRSFTARPARKVAFH